jgi:hypothetical protein
MNEAVKQVSLALRENYLGLGSTPHGAFMSLTDDLRNNRITADDMDATCQELLQAIGELMAEITNQASSKLYGD